MRFRVLGTVLALLVLGAVLMTKASSALAPQSDVFRATLGNGLRVIIVRNTIAPVASTDLTYLVGSRDDPPGVPGMAHAQEHMMYRGTPNLSTSELGTVATALGGDFNASTTDTTTQFQFTVPAADLDAVLRIESDRMRDVLDAQAQWQNERGAIEQEVLRDEVAPGNDFFDEVRALAFKGTHYAHDGVGTKAAFDRLTGPQIKAFWKTWYAPNNAVLVIAGDVDPARTLAQIRARFGSIPPHAVPSHGTARFKPLAQTVLRQPTTLAYPLAAVAFRMPGVNSPDFLPSFVLQGILDSARGPLHALADDGEALDGEWVSMPYVPEAQLGYAIAALRPGDDPNALAKRLEGIVGDYAAHGVPRELFETTKTSLIASQELSRNSVSQLASDWAETISLDDEPSIAREQQLISAVTLDDVNRAAKRYLDVNRAIVGALTPSADASQTGAPTASEELHENPLGTQPPVTHLPAWATPLLHVDPLPRASVPPTQTKLSNGITLIVQPETISDSVFVYGSVKTNRSLQEPSGKEGVADVLAGMYAYGTQSRDHTSFQRVQDEIQSTVSGGTDFGLQTTSRYFDRASALLAENELRPRFDEPTFDLARHRAVDQLETALNSSHTVAMQRAALKLLPQGDPQLREPSVDAMQSLTLDDVKAYAAKIMRPDLTTIVVVGNVTPAQAGAAVERAFGSWHATGDPPSLDLPAVPLNAAGDVKLALPAMRQDNVTLEQIVLLPRSNPQLYPLALGNAILGGGSAGPEQSRLFRDLRQNSGLVYSIESQFSPHRTRSEFSIEFACLPGNEARIETMISAEIARMKNEPVGDFELALVKASMVRRAVIAGASVGSIGGSLLNDASSGQPLVQDRIDARHFLATDARAIQEAMAAYIHPDHFIRVIEGP
jgi:zinc protease